MFRVGINNHGFIRGGNWNNGSNAGAFTLNLNNAPTDTNTNIGFRVARSLSSTVRFMSLIGSCGLARVPLGHGRWKRAYKDLPFMPILAGCSAKYVLVACRGKLGLFTLLGLR